MRSNEEKTAGGGRALEDASNRPAPSAAAQQPASVAERKATAKAKVATGGAPAASTKSKRKRAGKRKRGDGSDEAPLFGFGADEQGGGTMTDGGRPRRKIKKVVRGNAGGCKVGHGFNCPKCSATCSYDSKQCKKCQLECCYEAGVGVVVLEERRGAATATAAAAAGAGVTSNESSKVRRGVKGRAAPEMGSDSPPNDTSGADVFDTTPEKVNEQALKSNVELEGVVFSEDRGGGVPAANDPRGGLADPATTLKASEAKAGNLENFTESARSNTTDLRGDSGRLMAETAPVARHGEEMDNVINEGIRLHQQIAKANGKKKKKEYKKMYQAFKDRVNQIKRRLIAAKEGSGTKRFTREQFDKLVELGIIDDVTKLV